MSEIKNSFTSGKMNKDLDERLVPSGEYRDAMNIQVSTSEGSDVGAIENILGNEIITSDPLVDIGSTCVGSIADEANDCLYYLVAGPNSGKPTRYEWENQDAIINAPDNYIFRDKIFKIANDSVTPVFVDNHTVKTTFDTSYPFTTGVSQTYSVNATNGIYAGMVCYFFNGPSHALISQSGGFGENDFSGPSNLQYGLNQNTNPVFYGDRSVKRIVLEAEYDSVTNKTLVKFDKNLQEEHQVNQNGLGEAAYVDSSNADYNYLVFTKQKILNFECNNTITGISILDDFLLFTDNDSEPKKINVTRSIAGTHGAGEKATMLVVPDRDISIDSGIVAKEEHVTVIKKYPTKKLVIEQEIENPTSAESDYNFTKNDGTGNFVLAEVGEEIIENFSSFTNGTEWGVGDELRFLRQGSTGNLPDDFDVRCKVKQDLSSLPLGPGILDPVTGLPITFPPSTYKLEILSISPTTPVDLSIGPNQTNFTYVNIFDVVRVLDTDSLFEKKFVRFGYRWKYQDGEYSTFSPFTDTVFAPSFFEYNAVLGYNKAMENHLTSIKLREIIASNIPDDVVQVDLLYIESNATTVYIVDTIKYNDLPDINIGTSIYNSWDVNSFNIKSDLIYSAVPANQLLRPYDNVPRKALALEVTGNRIVFANYLQNYNLDNKPTLMASFDKRWKTGIIGSNQGKPVLYDPVFFDSFHVSNPDLSFYRLHENLIEPLMASPSIKSIRSYQLGFTYIDDYGRETPVFTSDDATVVLNKSEAKEVNLLTSRITSPSPDWAKSFKMYIKETSNEYYNLPLDRVYKAEDGNLWLSFPSSERNKVDEQTYLILKKGADSDSLVEPKAKYKIIAIENEAPDFLKTKDRLLAEVVGGGGITPPIQHLFNDTTATAFTSALTPGTKSFNLSASNFSEESSVALQDFGNVLSFDFRDASGRYSKRYPIVDISIDDSLEEYTIVTETPILSSEDWMFDDNNALPYSSTLKLRFYKSVTRVKPEFDGKFFVKINGDSTAATFLNTSAGSAPEYAVVAAMNAYYFSDTGKFGVTKGTIGRSGGGNIDEEWNYYTSSNSNPHTGATGPGTSVIHPGLGQTGYVNQSGIESTDGKRDWELALDFGTSSDGLSNWFIDEIYYAGTHPPSSNNSTNAVDGPNVTNSFNYGKGVHEDSGQQYIEISFSQIGPDACNGGQAILNQGTAPEINFAKFNDNDIWEVGSAINPDHVDQFPIINQLVPGTKFRIANDDNNTIYEITGNVTKERRYNYAQWSLVQTAFDNWVSTWTSANTDGDVSRKTKYEDFWEIFGMPINRRVAYRIPVDKHINGTNGTTISGKTVTAASADDAAALGNTPAVIQFIEQRTDDDNEVLLSSNPAIFETEPKEAIDLNIFYEISDAYPTRLDINNIERYIPKGSVVTCNTHPLLLDFNEQTFVTGFEQNMFGQLMIKFNVPLRSTPAGATELIFTRADGGYTTIQGSWYTPRTNALNPAYISLPPATPNETGYEIYPAVGEIGLSWFNCYSFGNGVESNRLRDDFNQVFINKGVKASTTLDTIYKEERRGSGLIYSGLYNSKSGVNSLNQFIQAEKITKDLNTTYGTIQKLFSRNTDLIAFCEDRVLRILANKDAVFNADGNPNLIATPNVLGQTVPFSGDYGISTNPESFAFESYRAYFTDAKRGAVLRLSMDGLTNLSDYGMSRYFKDNLKNYDKILGSYDDKKDNYNLTLDQECFSSSGKMSPPVTISYKESVRGWVSFKSFIPESAVSMKGDYYTFKAGLPFKHHINQKRNTFYGVFEPTSIEFLLNQAPDVVKSFKTLNYEGSQAKVYEETAGSINSNPGQGYYNLNDKQGWSVQYITTDQETGKVQGDQFIEKEGKWFNYIQGNHSALNTNNIDTNSFHFQGIGRSSSLPTLVYGCVDPNANNYYSGANVDDGTCEYAGCTDPLSYNGATTFIHPTNGVTYTATIDDGSCDYQGCMTQYAPNIYHPNTVASTNYDPSYTVPGPCVYPNTYDCDTVNGGYTVNTTGTGLYLSPPTNIQCPPCGQGVATGCTDPTAMNYDSTPGLCHDASLCEYYDFGCYDDGSLDTTATNNAGFPLFVPLQTQLDSATNNGCNVGILPYYHDSYSYTDPFVNSPTFGTTISVVADNVTSPMPTNAGMDCGCEYTGCMDNTNSNYMPWATINDATMCCVDGCTDPSASNYDAAATCDDGSCTYAQCLYDATIGGIPTVSGTGNGANEYGLFNYTGPWFGVPIIQTSTPDVVFEEVLENIVTYFNASTMAYFTEFRKPGQLSGQSPEEVCTYGFTQCIDLLLTSKIVTSPVSSLNPNGSAEWQSSENYGNGLVSDLSGLQDFHLPQLQPMGSGNPYQPLANNVAAQSFRNLAVHMQNISSFIHSETDPNSDYYGLNMLDVFSSQYNGTTFGSGLSQISFKSLPLSSMIKLDLSNHKQLYSVEIADCGLKEITLPYDGLLGRIFITNNYISGNYAHAAGGYPYAGGGGSPGFITGHGYVGLPNMNPNLPDEITGNNGGSNYSYNDPGYDKIGNPANPIKIHAIGGTSSSTYYPIGSTNPMKRFDWNNGTPQQGSNVDQRSIIRLINLPELMHVYLDLDLLVQTKNGVDVIGKMENAYDGTGNNMNHKAAFTTLGCHPDMKIHVGSQAMVDICERSFGTSDQSSPNWTQEGETFFLQYFEDGHRFII